MAPKKITRISPEGEVSNDKENSFVAMVGGKPTLIKYQEGFVGDDDEDSDEDLSLRIEKMGGDHVRELTPDEEWQLMLNGDIESIHKHEQRVNEQMDRIITMETYTKRVDEDE